MKQLVEDITLVMPVMRNQKALLVIKDLARQTMFIKNLVIVNNSLNFQMPIDFIKEIVNSIPTNFEIVMVNKNIGTNASWNFAFNYKTKYIGIIGDDYRFGKNTIRNLIHSYQVLKHNYKDIGFITSAIKRRNVPIFSSDPYAYLDNLETGEIKFRDVRGKSHFGLIIAECCFFQLLPEIPKEFFIFFGDDWFGYWTDYLKKKIYEISSPIVHKGDDDLHKFLNYKKVLEQERITWKKWLRGEIEL